MLTRTRSCGPELRSTRSGSTYSARFLAVVTDLLAWTVAELKPGQRPAWVWQSAHDTYKQMLAEVPVDEIPPEIRTGELRYQAALEREQRQQLPAAS